MDRLTIKYEGLPVPKKTCTVDRFGEADDCEPCDSVCCSGLDCRDCVMQECFTRLGEYEDTGLTPEQIRELKERDTAKAAIITGHNRAIGCKVGECPTCGEMTRDYLKFCRECGQRLRWED